MPHTMNEAEEALNGACDASDALDKAIALAGAAGVSREVVAALAAAAKLAKEELGTDEDQVDSAPRKWYVGDAHDNFGEFDNIEEGARQAGGLVADGFVGVYMMHLTESEFEMFCKTGIPSQFKRK